MPKNGMEFFFSGILIKIFQIPLLFARSSSDDAQSNREGAFII